MHENPTSQPPAPDPAGERTAHLDGLRVAYEHEGDRLGLRLELWAGGRPAADLFPPARLFDRVDAADTRAEQDRVSVLLQALCIYLNAGGELGGLVTLVGNFARVAPAVRPPLTLVSLLPPFGGHTLVWARPDGRFLRVVEGEEGFAEVLTAEQLRDAETEQVPVADPAGGGLV